MDTKGAKLNLHSDVNTLTPHPNPDSFSPDHRFIFPLGGTGPYLCTQSFNGSLTHFYSTTHHAVDFRAPVGTPVMAVGDGIIVEITQHNNVSGIHVRNLFLWNSVMLQLDCGVFVEYPSWLIYCPFYLIKVGMCISKSIVSIIKSENELKVESKYVSQEMWDSVQSHTCTSKCIPLRTRKRILFALLCRMQKEGIFPNQGSCIIQRESNN